mmetsp:Transcript_36154/g.55525  ORF Transcript_36154/g.55525 Transcript_36154/m.55525 type:complete len:135 (-) Transcript_36154:90-494(-)
MLMILLSFASSFDYAHQATFCHEGEHPDDELSNLIYNIIFGADMVVKLFTEHRSVTSEEVVRDTKRIIKIYLSGEFWIDFLAIVPFVWLVEESLELEPRQAALFYYLKLVRLITGFKMLNYKTFLNYLKSRHGN